MNAWHMMSFSYGGLSMTAFWCRYHEYAEAYEERYPIYLRLHADLAQNGQMFRDLENRYLNAPDQHTKEKMYAKIKKQFRIRQQVRFGCLF